MGSVWERKYKSGVVRYRAAIQVRGYPKFSLSFDSHEEACDWLINNERSFRDNPKSFFDWRDELRQKMIRERKKSVNGIVRPRLKLFD